MSKTRLPLSQRMTAALALALFCWLNILAFTPVLHAKAHCESSHNDGSHPAPVQSPEHQCAVTWLAQGKLDVTPPVLVPKAPAEFVFTSVPVVTLEAFSADLRLVPGRAPPA